MEPAQLFKDIAPVLTFIASIAAAAIGVWGGGSVKRKNLEAYMAAYDWCTANGKLEQRRQIEDVLDGTIERLHRAWSTRSLLYWSVALFVESVALFVLSLMPTYGFVSFVILLVAAAVSLIASGMAAWKVIKVRQGEDGSDA